MNSIPTHRTKVGFTLVELLVVLAVLMLLISLLFPAVDAVRARAKVAGCASNLQQVGAALLQYAVEKEGKLPYGISGRTTWTLQVAPYLEGVPDENTPSRVLRCPAHTAPLVSSFPGTSREFPVCSYGALTSNALELNSPEEPYSHPWSRQRVFLGNFGSDHTLLPDRRPVYMIPDPSNTAMITENAHALNDQAGVGNILYNVDPYQISPDSVGVQTGWPTARNMTLLLHNGKVNYLFADGHVETLMYNAPRVHGSGTLSVPFGIWTVTPGD